ncbi:MAG: hypothetical protein FWF60_05690 [Oscillospiraceae bacterium]|nr:hypothetical protein [Oscillospiraceae bacterium]
METKQLGQPILEVTSSWDYEALKKFNKFWRNRTSIKRFVFSGTLMLLPAAIFAGLAVFSELWVLWLLPLGCIGFSVFCFVTYRRYKDKAIAVEKPKLREQSNSAVLLICFPMGVILGMVSDTEYSKYVYPALMLVLLVILLIYLRMAKKKFKALEYTCTFYASYLFFSYNALEMLVQKGIPYSTCYAQETNDTFYVEFPAERNGLRSTYPYYDSVILEKQKLTPGQADTLRELFARVCGARFTTDEQTRTKL